jgi:hypothetical protein
MVADEAALHDFPDRSIRQQLENPENLRDLLSDALPDLAAGFDYSRVEWLPRDCLLEDWRGRASDLLFRLPYRTGDGEQWVLVCLLIEHQSTADPRMPLRMLLYTVLVWEREWKTWEEQPVPRPAFQLTPVVPIVFHTGARPWGSHRQLADLLGGPEVFRKFAPHYQPLFWDLAEHDPEDLVRKAAAWLQALAVVRVEDADPATFRRVMLQVEQQRGDLSVRDRMRWRELMRFVLAWAHPRRPQEEFEDLLIDALAAQADVAQQQEIQSMRGSMAELIYSKGRAEGELIATREFLRDRLGERFGRLPDDLLRRIESTTDLGRLKTCLRQVNTVSSLDELSL